jgi:putative aldouronate transport system permease protein
MPPRKEDNSWTNIVKHRQLLFMFLPCFCFYVLFNYIPMLGQMVAFKEYSMRLGIVDSPWVGLDHFYVLFTGQEFLLVLRNTIVISLLKLVCGFGVPILLALLLNEIRVRWFARGIQTLALLPHLFSWVILAGIFRLIFANSGPANELIQMFGAESPIAWLTNDQWFIAILIGTDIWKGMGYGAIIYLATISGISTDLYEAATIDGANRFQQAIHITLASLRPTIITLLVLSMGGILTAGFDQIFNMYNPLVYDVADIIDTYVLRLLIGQQFEAATAAGLFIGLVGLIMILVANKIAKKLSDGDQGLF